ncbi:hypothetical protein KCU90_g80, partial [Aureobasidium melanogenum]
MTRFSHSILPSASGSCIALSSLMTTSPMPQYLTLSFKHFQYNGSVRVPSISPVSSVSVSILALFAFAKILTARSLRKKGASRLITSPPSLSSANPTCSKFGHLLTSSPICCPERGNWARRYALQTEEACFSSKAWGGRKFLQRLRGSLHFRHSQLHGISNQIYRLDSREGRYRSREGDEG